LYDRCAGHARFSVSSRERVDFLFTIRHYAGSVTYDTSGFLDKNRDQLYQVRHRGRGGDGGWT
jgi:myosin-5